MCIFDDMDPARSARQRNNALLAFRKGWGTLRFMIDEDGALPASKGAKLVIAPILKMSPRTHFAFLYALATLGVERGMIRRQHEALTHDGTEFRLELPPRRREQRERLGPHPVRSVTSRTGRHCKR